MTEQPTVFLVDDDHAVRDSLAFLFEAAGLTVQAYSSAESFLESYSADRVGCLVLDVKMPGMSGPDLQAELLQRASSLPVIFLSGNGDIPLTVKTIKAGALDFLTKPVQARPLLKAVQSALIKDVQARERQRTESEAGRALSQLTAREREIAHLLIDGRSNKSVAKMLGISHRTVENHRARIMEKTRAANLIQLARLLETKSPSEPVAR